MKAAVKLKEFLKSAVSEYKGSSIYEWATEGDKYARQLNTTITKYQKLLYKITGEAVPDNYSANHKCASNFFSRFVTQECQYLLGNGVQFNDEKTKERLGGSSFDIQIQKAAKAALVQGVSYCFFNYNHLEVFKATELVPIWDEETGALMAAIRFWQISADKPVRYTLFELDGYTEYISRKGKDAEVLKEKRPYKEIVRSSAVDGAEIIDGENYPGFPIIPLWGNPDHQSELVGLKSQIDAYDLIKSGFANDLDDASMIYWTINNAGGMDEMDLVQFLDHMKRVKAAVVESDGASAQAHTMDVPYQSRETYLSRLEQDMYNDAMALNVNQISAGNITATAIQAAYEPLNNKTDQFEFCVTEAIKGILELIEIEDDPTYKRSRISNQTEETTMILAAAQYLDTETILKHLPFLSPDEVDGILDRVEQEEAERFAEVDDENDDLSGKEAREETTDN